MKKYVKPESSIKNIISSVEISSLNDWLSSNPGSDYADAGIITYTMLSE